jgi:protein-L-isoaspartate(D-aspartate) O-methyltransferase
MDAPTRFTDETAVFEADDDPFAAARNHMVDSQVRPNKVTNPHIVQTMRRLPREAFLPPELAPLAYADAAVRLPGGRALMQPMVIARLIQLAAPHVGDRALVAGCGAGYGAAVLAGTGAAVLALEEDEALIAAARVALPAHAPNVALVTGPIADGWPQGGPYDIILLEGAVRDIPAALGAQLAPGRGRLVTVLVGKGRSGMAVLAEPTAAGLRAQPMFDCNTPPIASLLPPPGFVF